MSTRTQRRYRLLLIPLFVNLLILAGSLALAPNRISANVIQEVALADSNAPTFDHTVGDDCTYPTIAAAINAANPDDRILIEGGVTFAENIKAKSAFAQPNFVLEGWVRFAAR